MLSRQAASTLPRIRSNQRSCFYWEWRHLWLPVWARQVLLTNLPSAVILVSRFWQLIRKVYFVKEPAGDAAFGARDTKRRTARRANRATRKIRFLFRIALASQRQTGNQSWKPRRAISAMVIASPARGNTVERICSPSTEPLGWPGSAIAGHIATVMGHAAVFVGLSSRPLNQMRTSPVACRRRTRKESGTSLQSVSPVQVS